MKSKTNLFIVMLLLVAVLSACATESPLTQAPTQRDTPPPPPNAVEESAPAESGSQPETTAPSGTTSFKLEAWADNWFAAYLGEDLIVEDSVPITTERSFNAETATFDASYPLTLNVIMKDFKENDTGLEYIGTPRQQMGDGGFIMQLTDLSTGEVVAVSNADWSCTVIHEAPLDKSCAAQANPVAGTAPCTFSDLGEPAGWKSPDYDVSAWDATTIYSANDVRPKDGYDQIAWDADAEFIWGPDLQTSNTVLCRTVVSAPVSDASASAETSAVINANPSSFSLTSASVAEGGSLPAEYTCDGASATLPLSWEGAPDDDDHAYKVLPYAQLLKCVDAHIKLNYKPSGMIYSGLDVADVGNDTNAYAVRQGSLLSELREWRVKYLHMTAQKADFLNRQGNVYQMHYDAGGLGAGIKSDLARIGKNPETNTGPEVNKFIPFLFGGKVKGPERFFIKDKSLKIKNKDYFARANAQLWWAIKLRVQNTIKALDGEAVDLSKCFFIDSKIINLDQLLVELSQCIYDDSSGKITVDKAPDNAPSPNLADGVLLAFAHDIKKGLKAY